MEARTVIETKKGSITKKIILSALFLLILMGTGMAQAYPAIPNSGYPSEMARGTFFSNSGEVYVFAAVDGKPTLYNITKGQYVNDEKSVKDVAEILKISNNPQIQKNSVQNDVKYIQETQKNANILKYLRPFRDSMLSLGTDLLFTILTPWNGNNTIDLVDSTVHAGIELFKTEAHTKAFILRDANKKFDMLIAQGNRNVESYEKMLTYKNQILPLSLYYEIYLNQIVKGILYPEIVELVSDLYTYDDDVFNKIGENIVSKFSDIGIDKISTVADWYSFIFESYILEIPEYQTYSKKVINNTRQIQEALAFYEQSMKLITAALTTGEMKIPEEMSYDIKKEKIEEATDEKIAGIEIPHDDEIIVYTQFFYKGTSKRLKIGGYCTLDGIGLNENISSIKIGRDVKVVLYKEKNFGNSDDKFVYPNLETRGAEVPTIEDAFNKKIQSLVVMKKSESKDYKPECPDSEETERKEVPEKEEEESVEPEIPSDTSKNTDDVVILYTEPGFSGESKLLTVGGYCTSHDFQLPNDSISSIKVGKNVKAVVYKGDRFNDGRLVLPSDEDIRDGKHEYSRLPVDYDEQISSIVVMGINDSKDYKPDCGGYEKPVEKVEKEKESEKTPQPPEIQKPVETPVEQPEQIEIDKEKIERQRKQIEDSFSFSTQNGSFDKDTYEEFYSVVVPGDGKLIITCETDHELRVYLYLYDVCKKNQLSSVQTDKRNLTLEQDGLAKGTYFIKIQKSYGKGSFKIDAEFVSAKYFDIYETNDSVATAQNIGRNTEIESLIGFGNRWVRDSIDWYKVTIPGYGKLTVSAAAEDELRSAYIHIYNTDGRNNMVYDQNGKKDSKAEKDGLAAGTYFIKIEGYGFGPYKLKTEFTPVKIKGDNEPNDDVSHAQAISLEEEIHSLIGYSNHWHRDDIDWYRVTIPGYGKLTVSAAAEDELRSAYIHIYNTDGRNNMVYDQNGKKDSKAEKDGLAAGTYFIRVEGNGFGPYKLKTTFTPAKIKGDNEPNDDVSHAQAISLEEEIHSLIGYSNHWYRDDIDWYKVTIPGYGKLTVSAAAEEELRSAYIHIYNTDGRNNMVYDQNGKKDSKAEKDGLAAGTYFIRVEGNGFGPYKLKTTFTPANIKGDNEPNDDVSHAQSIPIGETITGLIGYTNHWESDSIDWYKVTLPSKGKVVITTKAKDELRSAYIYLYNVDGYNSIANDQNNQRTSTIEKEISESGTYFIRVQNSGFGEYSLSVSFSGSSD